MARVCIWEIKTEGKSEDLVSCKEIFNVCRLKNMMSKNGVKTQRIRLEIIKQQIRKYIN